MRSPGIRQPSSRKVRRCVGDASAVLEGRVGRCVKTRLRAPRLCLDLPPRAGILQSLRAGGVPGQSSSSHVMQIYIAEGTQQTGPFDLETIKTGLRAGKYQPSQLAWFEGAAGWEPLSKLPGLETFLPPPPAAPPAVPSPAPPPAAFPPAPGAYPPAPSTGTPPAPYGAPPTYNTPYPPLPARQAGFGRQESRRVHHRGSVSPPLPRPVADRGFALRSLVLVERYAHPGTRRQSGILQFRGQSRRLQSRR